MDDPETSYTTRLLLAGYRQLLSAYPDRFRREHAALMLQLLGDMCREAEQRGRLSDKLRVLRILLFDVVRTIPGEHLAAFGLPRNLRGPAFMLGGALFSAGFLLSNTGPEYGGLISPGEICLAFSSLLLTIGALGLRRCYADRQGRVGRALLMLAALSSTLAMAGGVGLALTRLDLLWGVRMLGMLAFFSFLALYGLVSLIRRPLPRFNGLPLLIGAWIPAGGLYSGLYHWLTGNWLGAESPITTGILLTIGLGFLLLGITLQTDLAQPPDLKTIA